MSLNIYDAAKILGLSGEFTPELVKSAYRQAYEVLKAFSGTLRDPHT